MAENDFFKTLGLDERNIPRNLDPDFSKVVGVFENENPSLANDDLKRTIIKFERENGFGTYPSTLSVVEVLAAVREGGSKLPIELDQTKKTVYRSPYPPPINM